MIKTKVLYKTFLILILGFQISSIFGQIDTELLKKDWIAIECRHATDSAGIYSVEGKLMSFGDNQGESYFFWKDSLFQFSYSLQDSLIVFNDTLVHGKIIHLDNDSLLLLVDNATMITLFLPVEGNSNVISKQQLDTILLNKIWTKNYCNGKLKLDFFDFDAFSPYIKYCNGIIDNKYDIDYRTGYWSTFGQNGFVFLSVNLEPNEYFETGFFQITYLDSSIINSIYLSMLSYDSIALESIESLSEFEIKRLKSILTSKAWYIDTVQETYQFYGLESGYSEEEIIPIKRQRKDWLLKEDFLHKKIRYSFADSMCFISCDSLTVFEGYWSLSRDGSYLYLYNEKSGSSINKILKINDTEIIIRQKIDLKKSKVNEDIVNYDFIINLY